MTATTHTLPDRLMQAVEAIDSLARQDLGEVFSEGLTVGLMAHSEIESRPVNAKSAAFYRHFVPLRTSLVAALAKLYRRCFKLALANPHETGPDPNRWAQAQLPLAIDLVLEWIRDWYVLACDGENKHIRLAGSAPAVPGQTVSLSVPLTAPPLPSSESWRAPAWLFGISLAFFGIGLMKDKHIPAMDSEERLGASHTRLLLTGARRIFLWELGAVVERVRNEETAAAGAIPAGTTGRHARGPNKRKGWKQRVRLYSAIQKVLDHNPSLQGMEFCGELDKHHAPPLLDWTEGGEWREGLTWKEAWRDPGLRRKIRRVRQEAMKNR